MSLLDDLRSAIAGSGTAVADPDTPVGPGDPQQGDALATLAKKYGAGPKKPPTATAPADDDLSKLAAAYAKPGPFAKQTEDMFRDRSTGGAPAPPLDNVLTTPAANAPKPRTASDAESMGLDPQGLAGRVVNALGDAARHPIDTGTGMVLAPVDAALKLETYAKEQAEQGLAKAKGVDATALAPTVTHKDALIAAAQLGALALGPATSKLIDVAIAPAIGAIGNEFGVDAALTAGRVAAAAKNTAIGAGVGAVYSPNDPAVGAVIGGVAGGGESAIRGERITPRVIQGANLQAQPDRLLPEQTPRPATATARAEPTPPSFEPDFTVETNSAQDALAELAKKYGAPRETIRNEPETTPVVPETKSPVSETTATPSAVEKTETTSQPTHDYSSTQVNLPPAIGAQLQAMGARIPDEDLADDGRESEPHVTVKYGLHGEDPEAVRALLANEPPVTVRLGKTSIFPNGESNSGDVVKVDVDSPDLHRLNAKIAGALPNSDTHPEYKPHATIAYVKPGLGKKYVGDASLEGQTATIDRVAFSDKSGKVTEIPLTGRASAPATSGVRREPIENIDVKPERFQYKLNTNEQGVGRELQHVRQFNPDLAGVVGVWRDPEDGRLKVINGHHRYDLARRTGQPALDIREIDAPDAASARTRGALINIAEGRGTAIDAAKLFRDTGVSLPALEQYGISPTGAIAKDGLAIAGLHPTLFNRVVNGELPVARAAVIGGSGLSEDQQLALSKMLGEREKAGKRMSNEAIGELIRFVKNAGTENVSQETLFGTEAMEQSLAPEKAELSAYVKDRLAKDKRLFGFLTKGGRAARIEGAGAGSIETGKAASIAEQSAQAEEVYNRLSTMSGPVSQALTDAARRLVRGENANDVRANLYAAALDAVRATVGGPAAPRPHGIPEGRDGAPAAASPAPGEAPAEQVSEPAFVDPDQGGLAFDRERRISPETQQAVRDRLRALAGEPPPPRATTIARALTTAVEIPRSGGAHVYQTDQEIPHDVVRAIASRWYVADLSQWWRAAAADIVREAAVDGFQIEPPDAGGITLGGDALGINIQRAKMGDEIRQIGGTPPPAAAPNLVLVNPFGIFYENLTKGTEDSPRALANKMWGTLVHELTHQLVRGHGADFIAEISRMIGPAARAQPLHIRSLEALWQQTLADSNFLVDMNALLPIWRAPRGGAPAAEADHVERAGDAGRARHLSRDAGGGDRAGDQSRRIAGVPPRGATAQVSDGAPLQPGGAVRVAREAAQGADVRGADAGLQGRDRGAAVTGPRADRTDLFGNADDEPSERQPSLFGDRAGTPDSRSLKQAERAARSELEQLRVQAAGQLSPVQQIKVARRIAELERLVNRGEKISGAELETRARAEPPEERADEQPGGLFDAMAIRGGAGRPRVRPPKVQPQGPHPAPRAAGIHTERTSIRPGEIVRRAIDVFFPAVGRAEGKSTQGVIRSERAKEFRVYSQNAHALRVLEKKIEKMPVAQRVDLWDKYERGIPTGDADLDRLNAALHQITDRYTKELIRVGRLNASRAMENYLGRFWAKSKDKAKAANFISRIFGRRPFEGGKSFLKARTIESFVDGLDAGLTPLTYNYVSSQLAKFEEMGRTIAARKILKAELKAKRARPVMNGYAPPRDAAGDPWVKADPSERDPAFIVYGPSSVTHWEGVDAVVYEQLQHLIDDLGITHKRGLKIGMRGVLGYAMPAAKFMATRFAGPEGTIMHELGHILDTEYGMGRAIKTGIGSAPTRVVQSGKNKGKVVPDYSKKGGDTPQARARRKQLHDELRVLANMRREQAIDSRTTDVPTDAQLADSDKAYLHSWPEKMANIVEAYVGARDRMKRAAPGIYELLDGIVKNNPELAPLRDIQPSMSHTTSTREEKLAGPVIAGHWYVPRASGPTWQNHLSRGLRGDPLYDFLAAPGMAATQVILGGSGYHAAVIATEGLFSELALGADQLRQGKSLAGTAARAVTGPVANVAFARKVMREYLTPGTHPELATVLDAMIEGGFHAQEKSEFWDGSRREKFKRAFQDAIENDSKLQQAWAASRIPMDALLAGIELGSYPILGKFVPLMKMAATYRAVEQRLRELPPDLATSDPDRFRREMWDINKEMDLRFGMVNYENYFVNRVAKDLAQAMFMAPGWNFGTAVLAARGVRDLGAIPKRAYDRARGKGDGKPIVGRSLKYWAGAIAALMLMNGLITYWMTGEMPGTTDEGDEASKWKDFFAFRDGTYDANGDANRHILPGYITGTLYNWSHHPIRAFINSLTPFWVFAARAAQNRNYQGDMLVNPDDDAKGITLQAIKAAEDEFAPISLQNYEESKRREEGGPLAVLQSYAGVKPAPREIVRGPGENRMQDFADRRGRDAMTPEKAEARQERADILRGMRAGNDVSDRVSTAVEHGSMLSGDEKRLLRRVGTTPMMEQFRSLTLDEAIDVYNAATPRERMFLKPILDKKVANAGKRGAGVP